MERRTRAVFMRGGTSKGVVFRGDDLPGDEAERDDLLRHVLGSPDPYGRQLNGMGGGISSLSKALWVTRSERNDSDIDYTFAQVAVDSPVIDLSANCGNMTSAMGPFAVDEEVFPIDDGDTILRMHNTNTNKCIHAGFQVADGRAVSRGDLKIPGVAGSGAPVRLEFMDPSGIAGRGVLPTGNVQDVIDAPGFGEISVTICDSAALCVFAPAEALGLNGSEGPDEIDARPDIAAAMEAIRRQAAVLSGFAPSAEAAPLSAPKVALVGPPETFTALDGRDIIPPSFDIAVRMASMGKIHRAVPLTGAMCLATAVAIDGTVAHNLSGGQGPAGDLRMGNPSGVLTTSASVNKISDGWQVESTTAYRTYRRLMDGFVYHP